MGSVISMYLIIGWDMIIAFAANYHLSWALDQILGVPEKFPNLSSLKNIVYSALWKRVIPFSSFSIEMCK